MKTLLRRIAAAGAAFLVITLLAPVPAGAADGVTLIVHYTDSTPRPSGEVAAQLLDGSAPSDSSAAVDAYGEVSSFTFADAADDATLGFRVGADSAFPGDLRYVQAEGGLAEVWVVDGDPRVYEEPIPVSPELATVRDDKVYVPHTALRDLLGVFHPANPIAANGYVFDGHATGSTPLLTIYYGRDYHEIAIDHDRVASNTTTSMLNTHTGLQMVFRDIDGYKTGNGTSAVYHISFGSLERMLQVGTLVHPDGYFLLKPQDAGHAVVAEADPAAVGFDPAVLGELDVFAQQQVDAGYAAMAVSVVKDGKLVKNDAWGWAQKYSTSIAPDGSVTPAALLPLDQRTPATTDTVFDLASNSKMYATNYAIQRLVSEGELDLDRTIQSFPGWEDFTDANSEYTGKWTVGGAGGIPAVYTGKHTITVRDILNHVGGLIPDPEYPNRSAAGGLWYQTDDPDDRAGIIDAISRSPLRYAPRTTFAYSDVDYMILGLLVEQITGSRLDVYLEEEFYGPLGLGDTGFRPLEAGIPAERIAATELNGNTRDGNVSFGTLDDGEPVPIREYTLRGEVHDEKAHYAMAGVAGHAGLFSTTADMATLTQLMLNGGVYDGRQYFSKETAEQFVQPFVGPGNTANTSSVGLGWRVHSFRGTQYYYFNWGASRHSYGHQGWTGTLTVIDPVHRMTVTILTTRIHAPVTNPPNGFATAGLSAADLVPFVGLVYKALNPTGVDYLHEDAVAAVAPIEAEFGAVAADVDAALPAMVSVTDVDGGEHRVPVEWDLEDFDGSNSGEQTLRGALLRPAWLLPGSEPLVAEVVVTVREAPAETTAPTIVADPSDATIKAGEDAVFTASASGSPTPSVRWQSSENGEVWTDIDGATSATLTVTAATAAQSGTQYRAVFTNAVGSIESAAATLTVIAAGGDTDADGDTGSGGALPDAGGALPDAGGALPDTGGTLPDTGGAAAIGLIGASMLLMLGGAVLLMRRRARVG
ncbi:penicillin binding protein PBP4B [Microbacterium alcoholitolerans]|uniref:penicillin binding protein PBP4B n=1 Tax=unclassified Microbacterium TaxID=2609290 RepID=UPI003D18177B